MTSQNTNNNSNNNNNDDNPLTSRRSQASQNQADNVKFAARELSEERLNALKEFLKKASADEIMSVRQLYGDNLAVLKAIGLGSATLEPDEESSGADGPKS